MRYLAMFLMMFSLSALTIGCGGDTEEATPDTTVETPEEGEEGEEGAEGEEGEEAPADEEEEGSAE